jgi:hypothetical protein
MGTLIVVQYVTNTTISYSLDSSRNGYLTLMEVEGQQPEMVT